MSNKYHFGASHWGTIFLCFLLAMLCNAVTSDSENVILPLLADANGWDYYGRVLTLVSVAGVTSVIGNLLMGKLCERMGAKFVIIFSLFATAGFVLLYGTSTNYIVLLIGLIGTISCGQSIFYLGVNAIVANWFSHNKGIAMGFISVGPPVSTVVMVSALTAVIRALGVKGGIFTICIVLVVVAVVCIFCLKEYPKAERISGKHENVEEESQSTLTTGQLLRNPSLWFIILCIGICSISQTGLMAQWIVRYTGTQFESKAGLLMSICAVIGIFGSMLAGAIEHKLGTVKGYMFLVVWFVIALIFNFTNLPALVYISIPMFSLIITLFQIFMPILILSAFKPEDFKKVNALVFPISGLIGQLTFVLIAICKAIFGEVRYAYLVYAVLLILSLVFVNLIHMKEKEK